MAVSPKLQSIVDSLPIEERRALYERIRHSLSLQSEQEQRIYHAELPRSRREEVMQSEMRSLGLWDRLVFWFMRLFSHHEDDEVFLRFKLRQLRRRIVSSGHTLVDFQENMILPELPARVYEFYRFVYPLIPMFHRIWHSEEFLESIVSFLLEHRIPDVRTEVNQFMPMKEMQDLFMESESKQAIRTEVARRLDEYLQGIHPDVFKHLDAGLLPLYHLKNICLFPFPEFFRLFGADIGYEMSDQIPEFKRVRVIDAEQLLERLYFAIYSARRIPASLSVHRELLEYYLEHEATGEGPAEGAESGAESPDALTPAERRDEAARVAYLLAAITRLRNEVDRAHERLALAEVIKFFRKDPYYRFLVYMPKLNLREYYASSLTLTVMGQIEGRIADVRMGVIGRMITEIFGTEPPEFEHFRVSSLAWANQFGVPVVRFVKSMNVLYNYLRLRYAGELREAVQTLGKGLPVGVRDFQSSMVFHAAGMEDMLDRIRAYDMSFGPDSDEGKTLQRMRAAVEKDSSSQRSLRIAFAQKDREARSLLDKGLEHIQGLSGALSSIRIAAEPKERSRVAELHGRSVDIAVPTSSIERYVHDLARVRKLLHLLIALEEGY